MDWVLHLMTPLETISNYSVIADLHTLQITDASTKSSPARSVFNSRFLVTDVNSKDSSASRAQVLSVQRISRNLTPSIPSTIAPYLLSLPCRAQLNCQPSTLSTTLIPGTRMTLLKTFRHEPHRKHRLNC
jgi:hypothetical protein